MECDGGGLAHHLSQVPCRNDYHTRRVMRDVQRVMCDGSDAQDVIISVVWCEMCVMCDV